MQFLALSVQHIANFQWLFYIVLDQYILPLYSCLAFLLLQVVYLPHYTSANQIWQVIPLNT